MAFAALWSCSGYLLGSCPWGYWLVRVFKREDIRRVGRGNIGATNVWRTYGRWLGVPVVLLDVLKGFVPALLGMLFVSPHHLPGSSPERRRCRSLAAALPPVREGRQDGRDLRRGLLRRRRLGRAAAGVRLAAVFVALRYASLASIIAGISLPVFSYVSAIRRSVVALRGARPRRRSLLPASREPRVGCVRRHRAPLPASAGPRVRRGALRRLFVAALWLAPGALAAGWCGRVRPRRPARRRHRAQVHASSRTRRTAPTASPPTRVGIADDVTSMRRLVAGPGPDPRAALRPCDVLGATPAWTSRSCGCREPAAQRIAGAVRRSFDRVATARNAGPRQPLQELPRLLRRAIGARMDVCGTGGGRDFTEGSHIAVVLAAGLYRRSRPTDRRARDDCMPSAPLPAGAPHRVPAAGRRRHRAIPTTDVLYPFATATPLVDLVLDFNHDDYYAHSGRGSTSGLALAAPSRPTPGRV